MKKDDFTNGFTDTITMNDPFSVEKDLAGPYPGSKSTVQKMPKFKAKYAKFVLNDDNENEELEKIMTECVTGKKLLADEKWHFTKDGSTIVAIKYFIPDETKPLTANGETEILGRRRQRKALDHKA